MATCSPYSKEKANHIRLCNLLVDIGRQVLQDVFDNIYLPSTLNIVLSSNKKTLKNLRTKNILFKKQWDTLFPASVAVTSADFDITLLFLLLRNICYLKEPGTGWDKPPLVSDLSIEADLVRVKRCRNELCGHIINTAIPDNEFQILWGDIEAALLRLGGSKYQVQIQNFKDETIDPESENRFKVLWQSWEEGEEKTLNAVLEGSAKTMDAIGELHENFDKGSAKTMDAIGELHENVDKGSAQTLDAIGELQENVDKGSAQTLDAIGELQEKVDKGSKKIDELQKKVDNLELEKTAKTMDAIGELQENADKVPTSTNTQPNPHGSTGLPRSTNAQPNPPGSTGLPSSTISQPNPHGSTGLSTSTISQPNPHGSTGLPTSTISKPNPKNNAMISIKGKVKVLTAGGLAVTWAAGSAYIVRRYIDEPQTLKELVQQAIIPSLFATVASVRAILSGSFKILIEVRSLEALDEIWKSYIEGDMKKKLEKVLITDDMRKLAPDDAENLDISLMISEDKYKMARGYLVESVEGSAKTLRMRMRESQENVDIIGTGSAKTMDAIGELHKKDTGKYIFHLPTPEDQELIKYINSQLKALKIHAVHIRTKKNKNEVHICGTHADVKERIQQVKQFIEEYRQPHRKIYKHRKQLQMKSTEGKIKVLLPYEAIPLRQMIGKEHSNINRIIEETGASVDIIDKAIYVSGVGDQCKRAICEFRNIASGLMHRNLHKEYSCDTFDFVDSTGLKCDFELKLVDCPHSKWDKTKCYYKINKVGEDEDEDEQNSDGEINIEELQSFISKVLKKIQAEHDGKIPKADLWCHFGHIYVGGRVDEDDVASPACINHFQAHFNQKQGGWKMLLDPAVKDMEIKHLEELLAGKPEDITVANHVRYDLNFLTPLCLKVRVKFFLDLEGNPNIKFAEEDIDIREDSSLPSPIYFMCDDFYHRAKISIAIPSKLMDVRMTMRTVLPRKIHDEKEKEHEEILKKYFDKITINKDDSKLVFPDENLPEGFSLQFFRKCTRRSYRHQQGEDSFRMILSDEEAMDVIHVENVLNKKTDIHLHNDKWDQLLTSGDWKPEQIVDTLPTFLSVLKSVQANISAPEDDE